MSIRKFGLIILGLIALVGLVIQSHGPLEDHKQETAAKPDPVKEQSASDQPADPASQNNDSPASAPSETTWARNDDGHYVKCMITNGQRWFIYMPTPEEMQRDGQPVVNQSPSDDVWTQVCGR